MKRVISLILILVMLLAVFPVTASALTYSGYCGGEGNGTNLRWSYYAEPVSGGDRILTISGNGAMEDYASGEDAPWASLGLIKQLIIKPGVTSIGANAFSCYQYYAFSEISIPDSVTKIGNNAFLRCGSAKSVKIGSGVRSIGSGAFGMCGYYTQQNGGTCNYYYNGTAEQWGKVDIQGNNYMLNNASIVFVSNSKDITEVEQIELSASSVIVSAGEKQKIRATIKPSDAKNVKLRWESSDMGVATVDQNGVVTARSVGSTIISVRTENGVEAAITVKVADKGNAIALFNNISYSFGNFEEKIPYGIYESIFHPSVVALKYTSELINGAHGVCEGFVSSAMMFYYGYRNCRDYGASNIRGLQKNNKKVRDLIMYTYVLQHHELYMKEDNRNKTYHNPAKIGNSNGAVIQNLVNLAEKELVHINVRTGRGGNQVGHALLAYGIDTESVFDGRPCSKLLVYDCIKPSSDKVFIVLYRDLSGAFTGEWRYVDANYNGISAYNSDQDNARLSFVPYDTIIATAEQGKVSLYSAVETSAEITLLQNGDRILIDNNEEMRFEAEDGWERSNSIAGTTFFEQWYYDNHINYIITPDDTYTITGSNEDGAVETTAYSSSDAFTAVTANDAEVTFNLRDAATETVEGDNFVNIDNKGMEADYAITYMPFMEYGYDYDEITVTGNTDHVVETYEQGGSVYITGEDAFTVTAVVGNETMTMEATELDAQATYCIKVDGTSIQVLCEDVAVTDAAELPARQQAPLPDYDLESGTYTEGETLTLTPDNEMVSIFYTLDGSEPTEESGLLYVEPIAINKSMTVKIMATQYGCENSDVMELSYTLPYVAPPIANVAEGVYAPETVVELYHEPDVEIYYTMDGTDPFVNGVLNSTAITLYEDTTIQACAVKNGVVSDVVAYDYQICDHADATYEYESSGDKAHIQKSFCNTCADALGEIIQNCADEDKDMLCDLCGGVFEVEISGTNMTLGNALVLNFLVKKADVTTTGLTAYVTHHAEDGDVVYEYAQADWTARGNYYYLPVSVAASQMTDTVDIEIRDAGGNVYNTAYSDSVVDYFGRLYAKTTEETAKPLMVDMLNYGASAQEYFGYKTETLANAGLTAEQQALATPDVVRTNSQVKDSNYYGTTLSLKDCIELNFIFKGLSGYDISNMYAEVSFVNSLGESKSATLSGDALTSQANGARCQVKVTETVLADASELVSVTLYVDGAEYATATDSVQSYVSRYVAKNGDETGLYGNIMKLSKSALNYVLSKQ